MEQEMNYIVAPIARFRGDLGEKFGIPRQSGLVPTLEGRIVFERPYRSLDALRGIQGYSHLWLIWQFSQVAAQQPADPMRRPFRATVRPPRLGGNTRVGVFATRSPFRPNALGLSCVELAGVQPDTPEGPTLLVRGADLMDGTPIFDIKPYLPYVDSHPAARGGFTDAAQSHALAVSCPPALMLRVPAAKRDTLIGLLQNDPRPAYQDDPGRVYGMDFAGLRVRFTVEGDLLTVQSIDPCGPPKV